MGTYRLARYLLALLASVNTVYLYRLSLGGWLDQYSQVLGPTSVEYSRYVIPITPPRPKPFTCTTKKHIATVHHLSVQAYPEADSDKEPFLCEYRLTRLVNPEPRYGLAPVEYPNRAISPRYQVAGQTYRTFMDKAKRMILQREFLLPHSLWGRRPNLAFPNHNKTDTKILAIGNSHLRQVMSSFEWQYTEQIQSLYQLTFALPPSGPYSLRNITWAVVETFRDPLSNRTTTFYICYNYAGFHSPRWKRNLEQDIMGGTPLEQMDAIILGNFNIFNPKNPIHKTASLWVNMIDYASVHPELQINITTHRSGITLPDLERVYPGPILSLTSFRNDEQHYIASRTAYMMESNNPTNNATTTTQQHRLSRFRVVNARSPIAAIGGGECGHENKGKVASCDLTNPTGHRGVGFQGGIPDIVAWDVLETLHDLLDG